jgi:hypothetical protein
MHTPSETAAISSRRAEANRANAQKSTGPKSEAGRRRSSRNATRHGMLAEVATLLAQPNQELAAFLHKYAADFRPSSIHEEMLVQELAVAHWRLRQSARIEAGLQSFQMHETYNALLKPPISVGWDDTPVADVCGMVPQANGPEEPEAEAHALAQAGEDIRTIVMGAAWAHNPAAFALVLRYQSQARRDYFRALKQLEMVRTGRVGYLPEKPLSGLSKPIESEPETAQNETKPTVDAPKAAAATAGNETNPTVAGFSRESADSGPAHISSPEETNEIPSVTDVHRESPGLPTLRPLNQPAH